eukprot:3931639-Rhodomonas_salina.2
MPCSLEGDCEFWGLGEQGWRPRRGRQSGWGRRAAAAGCGARRGAWRGEAGGRTSSTASIPDR